MTVRWKKGKEAPSLIKGYCVSHLTRYSFEMVWKDGEGGGRAGFMPHTSLNKGYRYRVVAVCCCKIL